MAAVPETAAGSPAPADSGEAAPPTASSPSSTPAEPAAAPATTKINIELSGGLELLFGHVKRFEVELDVLGGELRMGRLLTWMRTNLLKERPELFLAEGDTLRPGILCLVNDADWELEGTLECPLSSGDTVTFISTLHGG